MPTAADFAQLRATLDGELLTDPLSRRLYATDASVYRALPLGVALPKTVADLQACVHFASTHRIGLIPRAAGTSLAGQCVGDGLVIDTSRYLTRILGFDESRQTVTVEPGVIRDDLNRFLEPYGLWFAPNTSTSSRCMIGGMVGNNSCGSTSIRYGNTRDKILAVEAVLSDGTEVTFGSLDSASFVAKTRLDTLEGAVYRCLQEVLSPSDAQADIRAQYPAAQVRRRNMGYAIDELIECAPLGNGNDPLHVAKLLAGSEGTLALTTAVTLQLDSLPPPHSALVIAHYAQIDDCLRDVAPLMQHPLYACEMLDKTILDLTLASPEHIRNRFFLVDDPAAILLCELRAKSPALLQQEVARVLTTLSTGSRAYARPVLEGKDIERAMALRHAGLGLLGNMVGDHKAVACIEDTAVATERLADYIAEFAELMQGFGQQPVYYAHAGAGELHLRPILNLKTEAGVADFEAITTAVARLVKRYGGSLSGEHGDGIVRAGYLPFMLGEANYERLQRIKQAFDPLGILNPGKVVDAYPMTERLRYEPGRSEPQIETLFDFSDTGGILRMAEKCNGAGTCRKPSAAGGTMCPSYRATLNERDSTRGRANVMREVLTQASSVNRFDSEQLREVFDLCMSCKGCTAECPSTVDVGTLKAEFEYQYMQVHGASLRSRLFAFNDRANRLGRKTRGLTNWLFSQRLTSKLVKRRLGIAPERSLPQLSRQSLRSWCKRNLKRTQAAKPRGELYLFIDEFSDQLDTQVGIDAIELLCGLGYRVQVVDHAQSGRAMISKGFLREAKAVAQRNVDTFLPLISEELPLVGIEPSAILTFRDEYPRLVDERAAAEQVARHTFTIDEFLQQHIASGAITAEHFDSGERRVLFHGHCHQKALSTQASTLAYLNLPTNWTATAIPSGCCGMAGSFGYEAEHFEVSMRVGNQVLFPAVLAADPEVVIAAVGTSCRHQILDGTGREAVHPVSLLRAALLPNA